MNVEVPRPQPDSPLLVDAHVHFHDCFRHENFFSGAQRNFRRAARGLSLATPTNGALLLTETEPKTWFSRWRSAAHTEGSGWTFHRTEEEFSLLASQNGMPWILVIAGRQIPTAENLEVLALGTLARFVEKQPMEETLAAVREAGALPVIPWGFGKWTFRRKRVVEELIDQETSNNFFLGDNSGRLRKWPRPRLLSRAEEKAIRILPGSDPLPFRRQEERAGSFGLLIEASLDCNRPASSLLNALRDPALRSLSYGAGERLVPFMRNQAAMQLRRFSPRFAR